MLRIPVHQAGLQLGNVEVVEWGQGVLLLPIKHSCRAMHVLLALCWSWKGGQNPAVLTAVLSDCAVSEPSRHLQACDTAGTI